jgi:hypothetical protein
MSLSDIGMVASSRRVVSLTARFQKGRREHEGKEASQEEAQRPEHKPFDHRNQRSRVSGAKRRQPLPSGKTQAERWRQFGTFHVKRVSARLP